MNVRTMAKAAVAAACLAAGSIPAQADILLTALTSQAQTWTGSDVKPVFLTNAANTALQFTNPTTGLVTVTYTAECRLIGNLSSYIHLTIFIDNSAVLPSGPDAAFCSGRGAGIGGGWAHQSITVSRNLAAGAHGVKIIAQVSGAHTGARLDHTTLLVVR